MVAAIARSWSVAAAADDTVAITADRMQEVIAGRMVEDPQTTAHGGRIVAVARRAGRR